ncbi:hypothetical protein [Streptomyces marincola]|uniref:hypothetical protein n=1 Tax=Streptomyces marincola TaxID=2878388 RepID=UPI001CF0F431|nr:hypothetical protein [Streptomyces marincola]UCM91260.1 hypothetical protein LC193_26785 [Streptomyces marincola]
MDEELAALAAAGAATLVAAMATDLWQSTREAVVGLFRRAGRGRRATVAAQLDNNAALVGSCGTPDEVRQALLDFWTVELRELLRSEPSCRSSLARLVEEAGTPGPGGGGAIRSTTRPRLEQRNSASDGGTVFAVQGGDQPHYSPPPGS